MVTQISRFAGGARGQKKKMAQPQVIKQKIFKFLFGHLLTNQVNFSCCCCFSGFPPTSFFTFTVPLPPMTTDSLSPIGLPNTCSCSAIWLTSSLQRWKKCFQQNDNRVQNVHGFRFVKTNQSENNKPCGWQNDGKYSIRIFTELL